MARSRGVVPFVVLAISLPSALTACVASLARESNDMVNPILASGKPGGKTIGVEPITVPLKSAFDDRRNLIEIAQSRAGALRLSVIDAVPPKSSNVSIRIFLNHPSAEDTTPPDDPHYVGSLAFFQDPQQPQSKVDFHLNLRPAIRRLLEAKKLEADDELSVTLLAAPIREDQPIKDVTIEFGSVEIRAASARSNRD